MLNPRATMLTVAIVATLAGGGSASATWGTEPGAASSEIAAEMTGVPVMELPNGCAGDDWSLEGSID